MQSIRRTWHTLIELVISVFVGSFMLAWCAFAMSTLYNNVGDIRGWLASLEAMRNFQNDMRNLLRSHHPYPRESLPNVTIIPTTATYGFASLLFVSNSGSNGAVIGAYDATDGKIIEWSPSLRHSVHPFFRPLSAAEKTDIITGTKRVTDLSSSWMYVYDRLDTIKFSPSTISGSLVRLHLVLSEPMVESESGVTYAEYVAKSREKLYPIGFFAN